jgi:L-lactate dehydrogenase (cytochrome)
MTRRLLRPREIRPLLRLRRPVANPVERRLLHAQTIGDLRRIAHRHTPRSVFDYVDGAADDELSLGRARQLFHDVEFVPSVLRDVSGVDTTAHPLRRDSAQPFGFGPTGFTRLMHHAGETAVGAVAARRQIPYALSTMGTTSIEDLAAAVPGGRLWFQLYVLRDRDPAADLMARVAAAGYEALMLTVDTPVGGNRLRDARNGFTLPPTLSLRTLADIAVHPRWWANLLTTPPLTFASLTTWHGTVAEMIDSLFDPSMTIEDLAWVRSLWSGPLIVKGIQSVADARLVVDAGADVVLLSNHGGRQLDRAPVPLRLLPEVVAEVGDRAEVWLDTGVMNGADIVAATALGADFVLVGRAYLYGLMAGGERGVDRAAEILSREVRRTMSLLGAAGISDLTPDRVRLPPRSDTTPGPRA